MSNIKAILDKKLNRYVLVDTETGEIVDDAQGYGFKTQRGAYAAWTYQNRDRQEELKIHKFIKDNQKILDLFDEYCFYKSESNLKPKHITELVLEKLNLKHNFDIKKIAWGIKDFWKIEKNIKKGKYNDVIHS